MAMSAIATTPPAIAVLLGGLLILGGNTAGWVFLAVGAGLNIFWLALR